MSAASFIAQGSPNAASTSNVRPGPTSAQAFLKKDDPPTPPPETEATTQPLTEEEAAPAPSSLAAAFIAKDDQPPPSQAFAASSTTDTDEPPSSQSLAVAFIAKDGLPPPLPEEEGEPAPLLPADEAEEPQPPSTPAAAAGRALQIEIDVHSLRIDETVRRELMQRNARRLWLELTMEPSVLLPTPLRTARVDLPSQPPRAASRASSGPVTELPLTLSEGVLSIEEGSALARALAAALASDDPRTIASMRLALHAAEAQQQTQATAALCETTISLQQLLRRGTDLTRAPLQLYGRENDGTADLAASVVVSLRAVGALQALVPRDTLPPPTPQQAGAVLPAAAAAAHPPAAAARTPAEEPPRPTVQVGRPEDHAAVLEGVEGPSTPAAGPGTEVIPDPDALLLTSSTPLELPIRLDLTVESLELSPNLSDDPSVARVQVAIDLLGLSEGALMTERIRKPPPSTRTALSHRGLIPVYDTLYAARCMRAQATAAAAAAEAAKEREREQALKAKGSGRGGAEGGQGGGGAGRGGRGSASTPGGGSAIGSSPAKFKPLAKPPPTTPLAVRLVGMGRGGIRDLGMATITLEDVLKAHYSPQRRVEVLLHPAPHTVADGAPSSPSTAGGSPVAATARRGAPSACARVMLLGKLMSRSAPSRSAPPPAQRADEPQVCVHVHSIRLPLRPPPPSRRPNADGSGSGSRPTSAARPTATDGGAPAAAAPAASAAAAPAAVAPAATAVAPAASGSVGGGGAVGASPQPTVVPPPELSDLHSVWVTVSIGGLPEPVASETVRMADLLEGGEQAAADAAAAMAAASRASGGGMVKAAPPTHGLLVWGAACPIDAVALLELFGDGAEAFEEMRAHLFRVGALGGKGGLGEAGGAFSATGGRSGSASGSVSSAASYGLSGAPPPATPKSPAPPSLGAPSPGRLPDTPGGVGGGGGSGGVGGGGGAAVGVVIELHGAGRNGHTTLGGLRLPLAELLAATGGRDLVGAPLRLRARSGAILAEVKLSVALGHAVDALLHGTPSLLSRGIGVSDVPGSTSGAAVAIGAGEAFLLMKNSALSRAGLLPTSVWVEVDLRRPLGQLLRSGSLAGGASRLEFDLRELLYVADGSLQQRRLAAALHPHAPAHASTVGFAVYCTATRRAESYPDLSRGGGRSSKARRAKQEAAERGKGEEGGRGEGGGPVEREEEEEFEGEEGGGGAVGDGGGGKRTGGPGRYLLGHGSVSLRRMLIEGFEPLTEPLDLVDDDGQPAGMLSVTLLARDALGRARRSSLRGPGTIEIWVGAETLLVAPTLRAALSNAALWLEIHLELGNVSTPSQQQHASDGGNKHEAPILHVASKRVRMPRSAPAGSGGLASTLTMALRGCISLPLSSAARAALQRALKRGSTTDASLGFFLFSSSTDAAPASERRPLASSRVSICDLLADLNVASGVSAGGKGSAVMDGLPLPVQLKNGRGELLATLSADVEGLGALRALAADGGAAGGSATASHNDPEALKRLLALRRSEAANKVATLVGRAGPEK